MYSYAHRVPSPQATSTTQGNPANILTVTSTTAHRLSFLKEKDGSLVRRTAPAEYSGPQVVSNNTNRLDMETEAARKVIREGILIFAGLAALLLQVAHPDIAAGVSEHSSFAYRPIDRLRTTSTYVYCMFYGTIEEKRMVVDLVNGKHNQIKGEVNGKAYDAYNPELQLWVASTLYATIINLYEAIFGKLKDDEGEKIYQEFVVLAICLQVPGGMWPKSRNDFWTYWADMVENKLELTPQAMQISKDLCWNKSVNIFWQALLPLLRIFTAEWLPLKLRDGYNLKTSIGHWAIYKPAMVLIRATYVYMPLFIREFPLKYYMGDLRERMEKRKQII